MKKGHQELKVMKEEESNIHNHISSSGSSSSSGSRIGMISGTNDSDLHFANEKEAHADAEDLRTTILSSIKSPMKKLLAARILDRAARRAQKQAKREAKREAKRKRREQYEEGEEEQLKSIGKCFGLLGRGK